MRHSAQEVLDDGLGVPSEAAVQAAVAQAARCAHPEVPDGLDDRAWGSVARPEGRLWLIDERDADGVVIGTTERHQDGSKRNRPGGRRGLTVPGGQLATYAGSSFDDPVLIAEGATDTAALFGLGFDAIGVPMAGQCGEWLASMLTGRHAVIVADADAAGRAGAEKIAKAIADRAASVRIIEPPNGHKDARAAVIAGATRDDFDALIHKTERFVVAGDGPVTPIRPVFDAAAMFPEPCRYVQRFASEVARSTQTPIEMSALACLAFASGTIANVVKIHGHGDHAEPPQLFALILSGSGTRKSSVFGHIAKPIHDWERDEAERLEPIILKALTENRLREKRMGVIEAKAAKTSDIAERRALEAEAVELAEEIAANPVPTVPELITSEPTPEALRGLMQRNHGRAILASPEADAFDTAMGRYSNGKPNFGPMLCAHAGDPIRSHRVGRPGDFVDRPALACCMFVQPDSVRDVWSDQQARGRGLLARFALVWPDDGVGDREARADGVDELVRDHWHNSIRALLNLPVPEDGPHSVRMTVEADAVLHDFQREVERRLGYGDLAHRRDFGGKLVGLSMRIALVLHALGTWARGGELDAEPVPIETMRCGIAWANYLADAEEHARTALTIEAQSPEHTKLLEWVKARGGTATAREVSLSLRAYRNASERARAALRELADAGHGVWDAAEGGRTMIFRAIG